ncbi:MAG: aldehyde-activating protein [Erythrobacter sp.]
MIGTCHCGAISVEVKHKPDYVNFCDCTLCAKTGGAWGYYVSAEVAVSGSTQSYRRHDYDHPAVEIQFCGQCGTTTHWVLTEHVEGDQIGVNVRLFEPSELIGIEGRTLDGRNWTGETPAEHRAPIGRIGEDMFI